ncbi:lipase 3-like [Ostrinia furnacalis]|uniref:lipase 3-like n=1 Tax=Ostrinia furnacalis TaxID=93504 RepID=UPI00103E865F|nr:lipase 3-like [Ostrinia furnacalis]
MALSQAIKIIFFLFYTRGCQAEVTSHAIIPIIPPNFTQLAEKAGLPCEQVDITTEDGYILTIFHIPGNESHPVLVQSGNLGTSDDYITRGTTSLPYVLWQAGYDVWMANVRGCRYGRRHVTLNPDLDDEFWNFSFHEFAIYDAPAMIDYILNRTKAATLSAIAWSLGTTVYYVLGAEKPEYNKKIDVMISFAPICYFQHSIPLDLIGQKNSDTIYGNETKLTDQYEVFGENSTTVARYRIRCSTPAKAYENCVLPIFFPIMGYDEEQLEPEFAPLVCQHWPSSSSSRTLIHQDQILLSRTFAQYDYGPTENEIRYGCSKPKEYDLSKNNISIVLISGKNDQTSTLLDVDLLKTKLPNVRKDIILEPEKFNHLDFVAGRDTHKVLYEPIILEILKEYNNINDC